MHLLSSNFNLISTNSNWEQIKKKNVIIDKNFNNFYLSLSNYNFLRENLSLHNIIYLTIKNKKTVFKKILSLKKFFKMFPAKPFFFYFFIDPSIKVNQLKKIEIEINKLKKISSNILTDSFFKINKKKFFNLRNLQYIKFPFDVSTIIFLCKMIEIKINLLKTKPYKLIILDCDNTLWGGVLDENKNNEILYGNTGKGKFYKEFQLKIKELKNQGFLLSICSKNNEKKVWDFLRKRKMALQKKDFISYEINWNEKAENISKIVKNLNLRFEDCIFIDDNALEIEKVNKKIKNLNTLHIKNINKVGEMMSKDNRFKKLLVSQDDLKKQKQYKLKSKFSSYIKNNKIDHNLIKKLHQNLKYIIVVFQI